MGYKNAQSKAEINPIIPHSVIIYTFWGFIVFCYLQVFTIHLTRSYCREITINGSNIDFCMTLCMIACNFLTSNAIFLKIYIFEKRIFQDSLF